MSVIHIHLDGDQCWPDLKERLTDGTLCWLGDQPFEVAVLPGGMASGKPSVAIRIDVEEMTIVLETSYNAFMTMANALRARYGEPR